MTIQELHYALKLSLNRIDSLANRDFEVEELDWLLNEAQLLFLKKRAGTNNLRQRGFEGDQKRIDDLSTLVVKYPIQPALTPTLDSGVYTISLDALAYPYFALIAGKADITADSITCDKNNIPLKFVQHDDYISITRDPFNTPSLEFIPYNLGRNSNGVSTLFLYAGDYTLKKVYLEYLKYPSRVSYGTYTYIDGVTYPEATLEFPEHTHQEIVDLAAELAANYSDNQALLAFKANHKNLNNE